MDHTLGRTASSNFQDRLVQSLNNKETEIQGLKVQVATLQENLIGRDTCLKYLDTEVSKLNIILKQTINDNNNSESADLDGSDACEVEFSTLLNISGGDLFGELAQSHFQYMFSEISGTVVTLIGNLKKAESDLRKTREQIGNLFRMADLMKNPTTADQAAAAAASASIASDQTYAGAHVVTTSTGSIIDSTYFGRDSQIQECPSTSTYSALTEVNDQIHSEYASTASSGENHDPSDETNETSPMEVDRSNLENTSTSGIHNNDPSVDANSLPYSVVVKVEPCVPSQIAIARAKLMEFRGPPRKCKKTPTVRHERDHTHKGSGIFCLCGIYFITTNAFDRHCMRSKNKEWSANMNRPIPSSLPIRRNTRRRKRVPFLQRRRGKRNRKAPRQPEGLVTFSCDICATELCSITVVKAHKKNVHNIDDTVFKIGCRICGRICFTREEFAKHRIQEHGTTYGKKNRRRKSSRPTRQSQNEYFGDSQSEQSENEEETSASFSGDVDQTNSNASPNSNLSSSPSHASVSNDDASQELMFSCTVCNAGFRSRGCLKVHMAGKHGSDMPKSKRKYSKRKTSGRTTPKRSTMSQTSPPPQVSDDEDGTEMENPTSESTTNLASSRHGRTLENNIGEISGNETEPAGSSTFVATIPLRHAPSTSSGHPPTINKNNTLHTDDSQTNDYSLGLAVVKMEPV